MINQTQLINLATFAGFEDLSVNITPVRMAVYVRKAQELDLRLFMGSAFYTDFIQWFGNGIATTGITINTNSTIALNGTYSNQPIVNVNGSGTGEKVTFTVLNGIVTGAVSSQVGNSYNIGDTFTCAAVPGALFTVNMVGVVVSASIPPLYLQLWQGLTYTDKAGFNVYYDGMIPTLVYWTFARFVENDYVQYTKTGPVAKNHDAGTGLEQRDIIQLVKQHRSTANAYCNDIELYLYNNIQSYPMWRWDQQRKSSRQSGPRIRGIDKTKFNAPGYNGRNYPGFLDGVFYNDL